MLYDLRLIGRPRAYTYNVASIGAGTVLVPIRAPQNKLWILSLAYGYHTAGANRDCWWTYEDEAVSIQPYVTQAIASASRWFFNSDPGFLQNVVIGPIISTVYRFPTFNFTATGAGENGYVGATVLEIDLQINS